MSTKAKNILTYSFIAIELFLYVVILFWQIIPSNIACYLSVIFSFLFVLIFWKKDNDTLLTTCALFFTCVSDFFLVYLCGMGKPIAMLSFSIVQILYFVRLILWSKSKKEMLANIIVRSALIVVVEIIGAIVLSSSIDFLAIISMFYFCNLLTNIVFAFVHVKLNWLFAVGLLLFAICDLIIGLQFVCLYLNIETTSIIYRLVYTSFNTIWLFYLPSQVMIAFSVKLAQSKKLKN